VLPVTQPCGKYPWNYFFGGGLRRDNVYCREMQPEIGLDNFTGDMLRDEVGSFIVSLSAGRRRQRVSYWIRVDVRTTCMEVSVIPVRMLLYPILVVLSLCRLTPEGATGGSRKIRGPQ
jgi:hypothetical protein